jgi:hypothetical protein
MPAQRLLSALVVTLAALEAPAALAESAQLSGAGTVEYHLVHKFHKIVGKSPAMQVRGTVDGSGLKVMARAQVSTFDSDNTNRDQHMLEAVEGARYPWVTARVALPGYHLPTSASSAKLRTEGAVELHGVTVNHPIELQVDTKDGVHFEIKFEFPESLTAHKVERPSLLFVPVDDNITIVGKAEIVAKR